MIVLYCTMLHGTLSLHHFYFTIKVMLPYLSSCLQFHIPHLIFRQIHSTLHLPSLSCASWTHHFSWWAGRFMSDVAPSLSMNRQEHRAWQLTYRDCGKHWFTYVDIETALFASLSSDVDYHASWLGHQWNTISLYLPKLEWTWFWTTQFFRYIQHACQFASLTPLLCFDLPWQDADIGLSVEIPVLTSHYFSEV